MNIYKWKDKGNLKTREYSNYDDYIGHQKRKLLKSLNKQGKIKRTWIKNYDNKYYGILADRLKDDNLDIKGKSVLCLAARIGTEVRVFKQYGCFAVGIDLEPGFCNKDVLHGDFHNIQFPNKSADIIFTNSLDHSFDIEKLIEEIKRVLKNDGTLILEVAKFEKASESIDCYEALIWNKIDDVVCLFKDFKIIKRIPFTSPWDGEHIILCLK